MQNKFSQTNVIIEGNIGAGKSTFLQIVNKYLQVQVVPEPHEKWQRVAGDENLLEKFYKDTNRWAYTFQTYAFVTRVMAQEEYAKKNPFPVQILERSVFSDRYCFAKNLYENGNMNELEWQLYQEWFSWLIDNYVAKPSGFIYLRTKPEICFERLKKRNRHEESEVSLNYLQQLHDKHESWLLEKKDVAEYIKNVPVLSLDCDREFENDIEQQKELMRKIIEFIGLYGHSIGAKQPVSSLSL